MLVYSAAITRYQSPSRHQHVQHITIRQSIDRLKNSRVAILLHKHKLYIVTILEWRVFILVIFANFTLIRASLRFIIRLHGRNVDRINAISCGNAEQVKLTTTKLMQNKEKNKNSELWNDNNEYPLHLEGKPSSIYCFSIDWCDMMRDGRINVWWNRQHFSEDSIMNMPHLQPQN